MSNPIELKYHPEHTWINAGADGIYTVGITGHAQEQLGDVVYVQPPAVGSTVKQGEACGVIESVKTAADVHAPASGVVTEINAALEDAPESVNADPYGAWLFRMKLADANELQTLLDAAAYEKTLA
ncbi:MAG: glycine cleavage system protein GcvH [Betaproteobacteria bacterium]|nr:glycine cleavage system protein GcvH [Betaproteobacteria bacterium]